MAKIRIIQLPEGVKIPNETLSQITNKAIKVPKEIRMEYAQFLISNWVKMNYENNFIKTITKPRNISIDLKEYLEKLNEPY